MLRSGSSQEDIVQLLVLACRSSAVLAQRITCNSTGHPSPAAPFCLTIAGMSHRAISGGTQPTHGRTSSNLVRQQELNNQRRAAAPSSGPPQQQRRWTPQLPQPTHSLHRPPTGSLLRPQQQTSQQGQKQQQVAGRPPLASTLQQLSKQDSPYAAQRRMWSQQPLHLSTQASAQAAQHREQLQQVQQLQDSQEQQQQSGGSCPAAQAHDTPPLQQQQQQQLRPPSPYHFMRLRRLQRQQLFSARLSPLSPCAAAGPARPPAAADTCGSTASACAAAPAAAEITHSGPALRHQPAHSVQQPWQQQDQQQLQQQRQRQLLPGPVAACGPVLRTRCNFFGHLARPVTATPAPLGLRLPLPTTQQQQQKQQQKQQLRQQQQQQQQPVEAASIPWHSFGVGRSSFVVAAFAAVPAGSNPAEPTSNTTTTSSGSAETSTAAGHAAFSPDSSSSSSSGASDPALLRAAAGGQQLLTSRDGCRDQQQQQQQEEEQEEQQVTHLPVWHTYADKGPINFLQQQQHHHQSHHQHELPPELLQLPISPAVVDVTHLLDMQLQEDAAEAVDSGWSSRQQQQHASSDDVSSSLSKQQQRLLEQQQRVLESCYGQQQQLLWVSVYQPAGGHSPASIWVQPWACVLSPDRLRFSDGAAGQVSVLLELPERPNLGRLPAVVVDGLTFSPTAAAAAAVPAGATSSVSSGSGNGDSGVFDFLLLSSGDFSALEYENMFPNALVHCGDGRQLHSARGAHDLAAFIADPELWRVRDHCDNLIRCAWGRDSIHDGVAWVYERLQQRWGAVALARLGVGPAFVKESLYRVMGQPLPMGAGQGDPLAAAAAAAGVGQPATAAAALSSHSQQAAAVVGVPAAFPQAVAAFAV